MVLFLVVAILALAVAVGVLAFAAYPQRGHPVPGARRLSRQVEGWVARARPPDAHPSYGVLLAPERDERARQWFDSADDRIVHGAQRLRARLQHGRPEGSRGRGTPGAPFTPGTPPR